MTQSDKKQLKAYVRKVAEKYPIDGDYLFGSQAEGNVHRYSDYDIAIVSEEAGKDRHSFLVDLLKLCRDFDILIEPHPMTKDDLQDSSYPLGREVMKYGVKL